MLTCLADRTRGYWENVSLWVGVPGGSDGKASACNVGDPGLIPGSGRSPGEGNGNPLQCSCLENSMDGGPWQATYSPWICKELDMTEWLHFLSFLVGIWVINLWLSITREHPAVRLMEVSRNWVLFTYKFSHFEKAHAEKTQACKVAYSESFYFPSLPVFCKHCYFSVFRLGFIDLWRYLWRLPLWNKVRLIYISVFRVCFRILWASFIWPDKREK